MTTYKYDWAGVAQSTMKTVTGAMKIGATLATEISKVTDPMKESDVTKNQLQKAILSREDAEARKHGMEAGFATTCVKLYGLTKIGMGAAERLPLGDAKRLFPLVQGVIRLGLSKAVVKRFANDAEAAKAAVKAVLAKAVARELTGDALVEAVDDLLGKQPKEKLTFWERAAKLLTGDKAGENQDALLAALGPDMAKASELFAALAVKASQAAQAQEMAAEEEEVAAAA